MEIRNAAEELKVLLGVPSTPASLARPVRNGSAGTLDVLAPDRATLSGVGTAASLNATDDSLRLEKVAEVRLAIEAGTYRVPAEEVASKLVDAMLSARTGR